MESYSESPLAVKSPVAVRTNKEARCGYDVLLTGDGFTVTASFGSAAHLRECPACIKARLPVALSKPTTPAPSPSNAMKPATVLGTATTAPLQSPPEPGVYILAAPTGFYKIGCSERVKVRTRSILQNCPPDTKHIHTIPVEGAKPASVEAKLHRKYRAKRVEREWFRLDDEEVAWLLPVSEYHHGEFHFKE